MGSGFLRGGKLSTQSPEENQSNLRFKNYLKDIIRWEGVPIDKVVGQGDKWRESYYREAKNYIVRKFPKLSFLIIN